METVKPESLNPTDLQNKNLQWYKCKNAQMFCMLFLVIIVASLLSWKDAKLVISFSS